MTSFNSAIPFIPSPNFSGRKGCTVEGVVIHYTAGGKGSGTVRWLARPETGASAHFIVSRDGRITQMVELAMKAWHAGVSEMKLIGGEVESDANQFTIGIELANYGWLQKVGDKFYIERAGKMKEAHVGAIPMEASLNFDNGHSILGWWEPYAQKQIDALDWLLKEVAHTPKYKRAAGNIIGHDSIAMPFSARKRDPGPLFPWQKFGGWDNQRVTSQML